MVVRDLFEVGMSYIIKIPSIVNLQVEYLSHHKNVIATKIH